MQNNYPRLIKNIQEHNKKIINDIKEERTKKCIIFGNGPSCINANPDLNNAFICRTNWFFLEEYANFGINVDAYFCGIYNEEMIRQLLRSKYNIKRVFSPFNIFSKLLINDFLFNKKILRKYNHWALLSSYKEIGYELTKRPLPTQGIQMILTAGALGFTKIETYGIDFYKNSNTRYFYSQTKESYAALEKKDITPGYEENHSLNTDLHFLDIFKSIFPNCELKLL